MPFPETNEQQLIEHLLGLGVRDGDKIAVHSRLLSFGRITGGVETAYRALRAVIGPEGTLVVPAYVFGDQTEIPYDPATTPAPSTGALGDFVRQLPDARRSLCPIHSHAAIGPAAELMLETDGSKSLGPGSDFEILHREGFRLILLGCRFNEGATYLHHLEAIAGVPYRSWAELPRQRVRPDGAIERMTCRYYARSGPVEIDFDAVGARLMEMGMGQRLACPMGMSYRLELADLHEAGLAMLRRDPTAFLAARKESDD